MGREPKLVPTSLFMCGTCSKDLRETSKDFYVNSKENEHLIENLSQQHSNNKEKSAGHWSMIQHTVIFQLQHLQLFTKYIRQTLVFM